MKVLDAAFSCLSGTASLTMLVMRVSYSRTSGVLMDCCRSRSNKGAELPGTSEEPVMNVVVDLRNQDVLVEEKLNFFASEKLT